MKMYDYVYIRPTQDRLKTIDKTFLFYEILDEKQQFIDKYDVLNICCEIMVDVELVRGKQLTRFFPKKDGKLMYDANCSSIYFISSDKVQQYESR